MLPSGMNRIPLLRSFINSSVLHLVLPDWSVALALGFEYAKVVAFSEAMDGIVNIEIGSR